MASAYVTWSKSSADWPVDIVKNLVPGTALLACGASTSMLGGQGPAKIMMHSDNGYEIPYIEYIGEIFPYPFLRTVFDPPLIFPTCDYVINIDPWTITHDCSGGCPSYVHSHDAQPHIVTQLRRPRVVLETVKPAPDFPVKGIITYGDTFGSAFGGHLPDPTPSGQSDCDYDAKFVGWFTEPDGGVQVTDSTRLLTTCEGAVETASTDAEKAVWAKARALHSVDYEYFTLYAHWCGPNPVSIASSGSCSLVNRDCKLIRAACS